MRKSLVLLGVASLALVCLSSAQRPASAAPQAGKAWKEEVKPGAKPAVSAATVDFAKELGVGFPSLLTLGGRIEEARGKADPVSLAAAARELTAAEKAGGKQASIKGEQILKEAIDMATMRNEAAELKAVAELAGEANGKPLLAAAQKISAASGEKRRGVSGTCHFDSRVNAFIRCYIYGRYVGTMGPMGDIYPTVYDGNNVTYLRAIADDGRFWEMTVTGNYSSFTFILNP